MSLSANLGRREWLAGLAACAGTMLARPLFAGAAHPISLTDLVHRSRFVVVGTSREATSAWEPGARGSRIVTYSRVEIQQTVDGRSVPDTQLYVRTLGGRVGDIGQIVHGEAQLELNAPSVLFLRDGLNGAMSIVAMAQGHYPLQDDDERTPRLQLSPHLGDLTVQDPRGAVSQLRGKSLGVCERLVLEELKGQ